VEKLSSIRLFARRALAITLSLCILVSLSSAPSKADDRCIGYSPGLAPKTPNWTVLDGPKMIFRVTWAIPDTNSCITGPDSGTSDPGRGPALIKSSGSPNTFPQTSWQLLRSNDFSILSATFEVPLNWIESSFAAQAFYYHAIDFSGMRFRYKGENFAGYGYGLERLSGIFYWDDLWAIYFSKKQNIYSQECDVIESEKPYGATIKYLPDFTYRVESPGKGPTLNVDMADTRQCIHLVGVLPVVKTGGDLSGLLYSPTKIDEYFAHSAISLKASKEHVSLFVTNQIPKLRIAQGDFARITPIPKTSESNIELHEILFPVTEVKHSDTVIRNATRVTISSQLDLSAIDTSRITPDSITGVYVGYYYPYTGTLSCYSSRWSVSNSGSTIKLRYSKGGCLDPAQKYQYQTKYMQIPTLDLLYGVGKADSERKAIAEAAEAKAKTAIELKAKQEAELKAKQEAELKAKQEAELKAKLEAEAKAAAELKAKQEADLEKCLKINERLELLRNQIEEYKYKFSGNSEFSNLLSAIPPNLNCNDAFRISAFGSRLISLETALGFIDSEFTAAVKRATSSAKKTTITCVKGKLTKKVIAVKPVCPKGYKKK
jgi:hypothetical protein